MELKLGLCLTQTSYLEFLPPSYYCSSLFQHLGDAAVVRRAYGKLKELMNSRLPEEAADQKNGLP
ncbi:unnamed protein product [Prunus armeniaca]